MCRLHKKAGHVPHDPDFIDLRQSNLLAVNRGGDLAPGGALNERYELLHAAAEAGQDKDKHADDRQDREVSLLMFSKGMERTVSHSGASTCVGDAKIARHPDT